MLQQYPYISINDEKSSFAYFTITKRLPKILSGIVESKLYEKEIQTRLASLSTSLIDLEITYLEHDQKYWETFYEKFCGKKLNEIPFFYAEVYFYGLINDIVKFTSLDIDPFSKTKQSDIESNLNFFTKSLNLIKNKKWRINDFLNFSLKGNKADLSQLSLSSENSLNILLDHSSELVQSLELCDDIHMILDNSGVELFTDLVLSTYLIESRKKKITLHVKEKPVFVSDTMTRDIIMLLNALERIGELEFVEKIKKFIEAGLLVIRADMFWNSPCHFTQFLDTFHTIFNENDLIISKGDANYRRFYEDRVIPSTTETAELTSYLPCPTFALRTLKSEIQTCLSLQKVNELNQFDPNWMSNGKYAVMQRLK